MLFNHPLIGLPDEGLLILNSLEKVLVVYGNTRLEISADLKLVKVRHRGHDVALVERVHGPSFPEAEAEPCFLLTFLESPNNDDLFHTRCS